MCKLQEPRLILYDLLKTDWVNASSSYAQAPTFSTGWLDNRNPNPQITITNPDFFVPGITGYSGIDTKKIWRGTVTVNCWAKRTVTNTNGSQVNPKRCVNEFKDLVCGLIKTNAHNASNLTEVGVTSIRELVDTTESPAWFRQEITIGCVYVG